MIYTDFINYCLLQAFNIAQNYYGKVTGEVKPEDNNQVLTKADLEIGQLLIKNIREKYPEHNIIDEEAGVIDNGSEYTWVTDPIDGTSNFANGVPTYGIMMGLLKGDKPIAGGVALPYFKEIYWAEKGFGSFCNGQRIYVTKETKLLNCLVAYQIDGHQEKPEITHDEVKILEKIILGIRNMRNTGSVFDTMMLARGALGGELNQTSKIWDNVAPQIIIEEAGGKYTDFWGKPMDYSNPLSKAKDNFTFCAASPALHEQLQSIINK